ncbi:MAG: exosortase E/protease, VPEID-CTERM system [Beijerinckiaceae bacterium]
MSAGADSTTFRGEKLFWPMALRCALIAGLAASLNVLASNKYIPPEGASAPVLAVSYLPGILKGAAVALALIGVFVARYREAEAYAAPWRPPSTAALLPPLAIFGILAIWLARTPPLSATGGTLGDAAALLFVLSPLAWFAFGVAALSAVVPLRAITPFITRGRALAFAALAVLGTAYFSNSRPLDFEQSPLLIEMVVKIASSIYGIMGGTMAHVGYTPDGYPVFASGDFRAAVEPSCSGFQGVVLICTILIAFTLLEYRRLNVGRVLLLIPIVAAIMFLINGVRIAILFYIGANWSPEIAVAGFHAHFGILSVAAVAVCAVAFIELAPAFAANAQPAAQSSPSPEEADPYLLLPVSTLIGVSLITGLFTGNVNWLYPIPAVAAAFMLWRTRAHLAGQFQDVSLLAIVTGVIVYALWIVLVPEEPEASRTLSRALLGAPAWLAGVWLFFRIAGSVIVVPLAEEMAFRGFLQSFAAQRLAAYMTPPLAATGALAIASIMFGVFHANMLAGAVAGLAYGLIYLNRRRLGDAIVAHAVTNLLIAIYALLLEKWSYW